MKAVYVKWLDPYSVDEWTTFEKLKEMKPMSVETIGYEIYFDEVTTIIALNIDHELGPQASCTVVIPNCCIEEYREIEDGATSEAKALRVAHRSETLDQDE
jgi:hypothetical protein